MNSSGDISYDTSAWINIMHSLEKYIRHHKMYSPPLYSKSFFFHLIKGMLKQHIQRVCFSRRPCREHLHTVPAGQAGRLTAASFLRLQPWDSNPALKRKVCQDRELVPVYWHCPWKISSPREQKWQQPMLTSKLLCERVTRETLKFSTSSLPLLLISRYGLFFLFQDHTVNGRHHDKQAVS